MAEQPETLGLPDGAISEWHPSGITLLAWTVLTVPIVVIGFFAYMLVPWGSGETISLSITPLLALLLSLVCVHEALHGIAVVAFGARPEFGLLKMGGIPIGFFTTAPGHRFSRRQYLIVALAPIAILTPLGVPACLLPFGTYMAAGFALVLAGSVGDMTIAWHVVRAPSGVVFEDLRDGIRFWRAGA